VPHQTFISYSQADRQIADAACHHLEAAGIRCWIAPRDIPAGQTWKTSIVGAIRGAKVMVLIFSDSANQSPQVRREVDIAFEAGITIVPFRVEDVKMSDELYYCVGQRHWLDAVTPPIEEHVKRLVAAVGGLLAPEAQELPDNPEPTIAKPVTKRRVVRKSAKRSGTESAGGTRKPADANKEGIFTYVMIGFVVLAILSGVRSVIPDRGAFEDLLSRSLPTTSARTGVITGIVVDDRSGVPIHDVFVQLLGSGQSTTSDADGRFRFAGIPPGTYTVSASHSWTSRRGTVEVSVTAGGIRDVRLPLAWNR
jgi:hypothetical protein